MRRGILFLVFVLAGCTAPTSSPDAARKAWCDSHGQEVSDAIAEMLTLELKGQIPRPSNGLEAACIWAYGKAAESSDLSPVNRPLKRGVD
jgi:hypothetical protein